MASYIKMKNKEQLSKLSKRDSHKVMYNGVIKEGEETLRKLKADGSPLKDEKTIRQKQCYKCGNIGCICKVCRRKISYRPTCLRRCLFNENDACIGFSWHKSTVACRPNEGASCRPGERVKEKITMRQEQCSECTNEGCWCPDCRGRDKSKICINNCTFNGDEPCSNPHAPELRKEEPEDLNIEEMPCLF